jgi:hypothetical protein
MNNKNNIEIFRLIQYFLNIKVKGNLYFKNIVSYQ